MLNVLKEAMRKKNQKSSDDYIMESALDDSIVDKFLDEDTKRTNKKIDLTKIIKMIPESDIDSDANSSDEIEVTESLVESVIFLEETEGE